MFFTHTLLLNPWVDTCIYSLASLALLFFPQTLLLPPFTGILCHSTVPHNSREPGLENGLFQQKMWGDGKKAITLRAFSPR